VQYRSKEESKLHGYSEEVLQWKKGLRDGLWPGLGWNIKGAETSIRER